MRWLHLEIIPTWLGGVLFITDISPLQLSNPATQGSHLSGLIFGLSNWAFAEKQAKMDVYAHA